MDVKDLVGQFTRAINAADIDALRSLLHPDVRLKSSRDVSELVGADAVCAYYEAVFADGVHCDISTLFVDGAHVAAEMELTERPLNGDATVRQTVASQVWSEGLLVEHRSYSDARQIRDVPDS